MQNQREPGACLHVPLTDRVLIRVCKQLTHDGLRAVKPLLMTICICSRAPALASPPQPLLRSSGVRFS